MNKSAQSLGRLLVGMKQELQPLIMKSARKNMRTAALAWRRNGWHKFLVTAIQTRDYALSVERVIKRGGV